MALVPIIPPTVLVISLATVVLAATLGAIGSINDNTTVKGNLENNWLKAVFLRFVTAFRISIIKIPFINLF